jgi:hypothetical protein
MALNLITNPSLPQGWDSEDRKDLKEQLNALVAAINTLETWGTTLATKLNADGGVTDTNYQAPSV